MNPIERPETLTEVVTRHIRDAIIRGDYKPGAALPEIRLAALLGTSRGTVREALRGLADQGLVEVIPHRGSFVSGISKRRARELYGLRVVLEAFAVRLAVEESAFDGDRSVELIDRLEALERATATHDPMQMIESERALHRAIWSRCSNRLLLEQLSNLQGQTRRLLIYNKAFSTPGTEDLALHKHLVQAILSGDPDEAEAAMRAHIRLSAQLVLAKMADDEPGAA